LVLFGAGNLGRKTLAGLRARGVRPLAFADSDPTKWGTTVDGLDVLSPDDSAAKFGSSAAFVVCVWRAGATEHFADNHRTLTGLGCDVVVHVASLLWKYADQFLPHYALDLPERVLQDADRVRAAFHVWEDDESRAEFVAQLKWRLRLDFDALGEPHETEMYYPSDLYRLRSKDVIVDCGVFDGDTLRSTLAAAGGELAAAVGFEPDRLNRAKALVWRDGLPGRLRDRITIRPEAVGASAGSVHFVCTGTPSSTLGVEGDEVAVVTLDETLGGLSPTFLKIDVEGAELDVLLGARQLLQAGRTIVAACAYHVQSHLWELPLLLRQYVPSYRLWLRPHGIEVWDLVCYAVPTTRYMGDGELARRRE
jgi:FkbM family methyltransferase